ncbi:hypothetical protein [Acidovorax sp. SUPP3334]|nr:hypothetical protein [Acidovorax sp. SUPP3334]GKT26751.1 hypothetical protein AVHM3334_21905 [Acidovorax sp. SUPP3334]
MNTNDNDQKIPEIHIKELSPEEAKYLVEKWLAILQKVFPVE